MKTFKLIGLALLTIVMSISFTACSSDDDEIASKNLLTGVWYDETTDGYKYFIVEDEYCYFSHYTTPQKNGEKYKYTYDSKTKKMECYEIWDGNIDDEPFYIEVVKLEQSRLVINLLEVDGTAFDTRHCTRVK